MERPNIVQLEFFHTTMDGSLEDLLGDINERLETHSHLKTVVRFYDMENEITQAILALHRFEKRLEYAEKHISARGILGYIQHRLLRFGRHGNEKYKARLPKHFRDHLNRALDSAPVAIEVAQHRFRHIREEEVHELRERVRHLNRIWVFVFEYNSLLADKNIPIAEYWGH